MGYQNYYDLVILKYDSIPKISRKYDAAYFVAFNHFFQKLI
jgi:hypothetical protein